MAVIQNIKIALETAIKTAFPTTPTNWENVAFNAPTDGSFWMAVHVMPASPANPTFGDEFYRAVGLMQVTLSYPLGGGSGRAYSKASDIADVFPRGSTCTNGGIQVTVSGTPKIGPGMVQKDRFVLPITINWFANVFTG